MPIFSVSGRPGKQKGKKPSPYDWTDRASDPLTENPAVLTKLAPWQQSVGTLVQSAAGRLAPDAADDALYGTLRTQAGNDLALGGELSTDEVRAIDQGTLGSASARGMARAPMTGFLAAMRRAQAAQQRQRERQGFAASVLSMGQQRRQADQNTLQTAGALAGQGNEFAEDIRRFGLTRYDTRQFNRNNIEKDRETAKRNAEAAKSAGSSSMLGGLFGGIGSALGGLFG